MTHDIAGKMFQYMDPQTRHVSRVGPIVVGNNVFIGAGATILYDVKIGDNVIIAAGAVVNRDIPSGSIFAGVPARKIGEFDDYLQKSKRYSESVPWTDDEPLDRRRAKQMDFFYPSMDERQNDKGQPPKRVF